MKIIQIQVVPPTNDRADRDRIYALTDGGQILVYDDKLEHGPPWFELVLPEQYAPQLFRSRLKDRYAQSA